MGSNVAKRVVLEFCERLSNRDTQGMKALVTEDARWWMVGRPDRIPFAGDKSFDEVLEAFGGFASQMESFRYTVSRVTAEDDRAVVEASAEGQLGDKRYTNNYMVVFELAGDRIARIREFMDLSEVAAFME